MRLFIAVELSERMRGALVHTQAELRRRGMRGRFVPRENLHLTLAFIGEHPDPDAVLDAMETVAFEPFPLRLEGLGQFDDLWWAGLAGSDALTGLAKRLRRALADAAIPFDRTRFTPHITLVRRASWDGRGGIPTASVPAVETEVDHITLMRSVQGKNGMLYTPLGFVP